MSRLCLLLLLACAGIAAAAGTPATSVAPASATVMTPAQLAQSLGVAAGDVRPSPIPGLYEILKEHRFGYVSADGRYLIQGDLIDMKTGEDLTEKYRRADRLAALAKLGDANMIVYAPPPPVRTRYVVTVFTDVTCPFCRKLHSEMAEYNAKGIAIRYAFFPRSGPNTPAFREAETVWCSPDRKRALDVAFHDAAEGKPIPRNGADCETPVLREYELGRELGLFGTPMMVLPNGEKLDGYTPPDELATELENKVREAAAPMPASAG